MTHRYHGTSLNARPAFTLGTTMPDLTSGVCRTADPDAFVPDKGANSKHIIAMCNRCPVIDLCREYALTLSPHEAGIWGGTSQKERRRIRAARKLAAAEGEAA